MRTFDVILEYKKKRLAYKNLTGKQSIKLMEDFVKKSIPCVAVTESFGVTEVLTLKEMQDLIIDTVH